MRNNLRFSMLRHRVKEEDCNCDDFESEFVGIEYYDYKVFRKYKCLGCGKIKYIEKEE